MRDTLYLALFSFFQFFVRYTPSFIYHPLLSSLAFLLFILDKKHRHIINVNLQLSFGTKLSAEEKQSISRHSYRNLVYYLADFVRNQGIKPEDLRKKVQYIGIEKVRALYNKGEKIIFITGHYGNWELIGLLLALELGGLTVVGRDLDSRVMQEILRRNREQFGLNLISKKGALKGLIRSLSNNIPVALLVDQNTADNEGILIDFFGKRTRHTPTAAILSRKFDAWIIPAFIRTNDYETYTLSFEEPFKTDMTGNSDNDIEKCVQRQADVTEKAIRQKPNEWFWQHRRWKNQYEEYYN